MPISFPPVSTYIYPETYGAIGNGVADDTAAISAAITAAGAGTVYFSSGKTYLTSSALTISSGLRLVGGSATNAIIKNTTSDIFNFPASNANQWEVSGLKLWATAGHIFNVTNSATHITESHVHDCSLLVTNAAKSAWSQLVGQCIELRVDYCDIYVAGTSRSVPGINIQDSVGGLMNANIFEKLVCTLDTTSTQYFFNLQCKASGDFSYFNCLRDIVFEQCVGGCIFAEGQLNLQLENIQCWDGNSISASLNDFIHVGKNAAGLSSRGVTIRNYSRSNSTLGASKYDISCDSTTNQLIIDTARAQPDNCSINLNSAPNVCLENMSYGTTVTNASGTPTIWSGSGAPSGQSFTGRVGDYYFRTDTPSTPAQQIYTCSVAGTPGTWIALGDFQASDTYFGSAGSGNYTIPTGATNLRFYFLGAGGGGASGYCGLATVNCVGGGGGAGGAGSMIDIPVSVFTALSMTTIPYVVGAGGTGGAAQTTSSTVGNNGTAGGDTYITVNSQKIGAPGGSGGTGGGSATGGGGGGATGFGPCQGAPGDSAKTDGTAAAGFSMAYNGNGGPGGGAGGGTNTSGVFQKGGANGVAAQVWDSYATIGPGASAGNAGSNGVSVLTNTIIPGSSGVGGNGGNSTTFGGAGGAGAQGAGGGGGGAGINGKGGGAGGNGGSGALLIVAT